MSSPANAAQRHDARAPDSEAACPLKCKDCGNVFPPPADARLPRCPRCGSARCRETQHRVAGTLLPADLSPDDGCFARVALWGDLITSEQFATCVREQQAIAAAGCAVPSLPELLIDRGYIRREHAAAVARSMTTRTPEQWRRQFGQIALRRRFVTEDQLGECLEIQTKLIMSQGAAPFLGHLLIERGHMTEAQVHAILKAQERRRAGLLHDLQMTLRPRSGRIADSLLRRLRRHERGVRAVALVLALALAVAFGAWGHAWATTPPEFDLICTQCDHQCRAPAQAIARSCPRCGEGEMCMRLWCPQCRVAFPLRVHTTGGGQPWLESCPACGTIRHVARPRLLTGLQARPRPGTHASPIAAGGRNER